MGDDRNQKQPDYFNPDNLKWNDDGKVAKISLPDDQWDLVHTIELNMFYDDGQGYHRLPDISAGL